MYITLTFWRLPRFARNDGGLLRSPQEIPLLFNKTAVVVGLVPTCDNR